MADAVSSVLDYLGRPQPIGQRNVTGLPSEGGGPIGGPVTGPGPGPGGPETPGTDTPDDPGASSPFPVGTGSPSTLTLILQALSTGKKFSDIANLFTPDVTGSFARDPAIEEAWQAFRAGERNDLQSLLGFGSTEVLPQVSGGELALGAEGAGGAGEAAGLAGTAAAASSFGAGVAPSMAALSSALSAAAPIWAGLTAAVDFLGEGKIPGQDIIDMIWPGTFGPSEDYMTFGPRLGNTLMAQEDAMMNFARSLVGAGSPDAVRDATKAWRESMGGIVPGYGQGAGDLDIPGLVGSTGTRHEGRIVYDPHARTAGLVALQQAALQGLPPEQRIQAFMNAVQENQRQRKEAVPNFEVYDPLGPNAGPSQSA